MGWSAITLLLAVASTLYSVGVSFVQKVRLPSLSHSLLAISLLLWAQVCGPLPASAVCLREIPCVRARASEEVGERGREGARLEVRG